jgi:hypothetical protein
VPVQMITHVVAFYLLVRPPRRQTVNRTMLHTHLKQET